MRLAAFGATLMCAATTLAQPPPVDKVTVHPDGAIVSRTSRGACVDGRASVVFSDLSPAFETDGLRAIASGAGDVESVAFAKRVHEQAWDSEVQTLENELSLRQANVEFQNRLAEAARARRTRATVTRESTRAFIQREALVSAKPDTAKWALALDHTQSEILAADSAVRATEQAVVAEQERIAELRRLLTELRGGAARQSLDVEVVVACQGAFSVELSALTRRARWNPVYEARAFRKNNQVALTALAEVTQGTGETWDAVSVTLSTALAHRRSTPPVPQRLYVGAREKDNARKVLVRRNEDVRRVGDLGGIEQTGALGVEDEGLSVRLPVAGRSRIAGDGRSARLRIETLSLPATFESRATPRLVPVVFVAADVRNAAKWPLLPGRVELFSDGGYLGTTMMERTPEGGLMPFAFGLDESVQVRRVVLVEDARDPGFFGSTRRMLYGYRFELEASKEKPAKVRLLDQLPVSELDDVKVVLDRKKTTPGFELINADGHISWLVDVPAGGSQVVELHFVVEIPEKYDSSGL